MLSLESVKVIVLASLFLLTLVASMIPVKFVTRFQHANGSSRNHLQQRIISCLSCFGGGVFLATCLLDLFPEVTTKYSKLVNLLHLKMDFPIAEFTLSVGFFIVLIIEQIVLFSKESQPHEQSERLLVNEEDSSRVNIRDYGSSSAQPNIEGINNEPQDDDVIEHSIHHDQHSHSKFRSILLVGALSLHSIFEGLAIGLQADMDDLLGIFAAVLIHKIILAFSLGLNLAQSMLSVSAIIKSNLLFSITSPIGVAIGIAVMDLTSGTGPLIASSVLQGIACGTFLYVTFFEVLPHEFNHGTDRLLKLLFVIVGFSTICCVIYFHPSVPDPI